MVSSGDVLNPLIYEVIIAYSYPGVNRKTLINEDILIFLRSHVFSLNVKMDKRRVEWYTGNRIRRKKGR